MNEYVIFLDIEGVLNTKASWKTPFALNDDCIKIFYSPLHGRMDGLQSKTIRLLKSLNSNQNCRNMDVPFLA